MYTLLIVEDDEKYSQRIELVALYSEIDIKVLCAQTVREAWEIMESRKIDVAIIDIELPDGNGIELAKDFRKNDDYLSIIIGSAETDPDYKAHIHKYVKNAAYLQKPYTDEEVKEELFRELERVSRLQTRQIAIAQKQFVQLISIRDLMFVETVNNENRIRISTFDFHTKTVEEHEFADVTLKEMLSMVRDEKQLIQCHKSFLINPNFIKRFTTDKTLLLHYTNEKIPVGARYRMALKHLRGE